MMDTDDRLVIGLDLGGTNIKGILCRQDGTVIQKSQTDSQVHLGADHVISKMVELARGLCHSANYTVDHLLGVGVGSPGPLDLKKGTVVKAANLPGWENVPIRDRISELLRKPAVLLNDANAAAYGEYWKGAGQDVDNLVLMTLGTGVGGGVICDGRILEGCFDNAGEIGHTIVYPDGRSCRCGQQGCLEAYAGGAQMISAAEAQIGQTGAEQLTRLYEERGGRLEVPDIICALNAGDEVARKIWEKMCDALAIACINIEHVLNPALILLGGGIILAGGELLDPISNAVNRKVWRLTSQRPQLRFAALGNDAGALGAAGWFLHTHRI